MESRILVHLNCDAHELAAGSTLVDALALVGVTADRKGVAVAVNLEVVRRTDWPLTLLADGARIDIVGAAQGG